jgi:hypothetical protein
LVEKQKLNESKNKKEIANYKLKKCHTNGDLPPKNQIIYEESKATKTSHTDTSVRFQRPIPTRVKLSPASITADNLRATFGAKFNEAEKAWPRHFNLDLSEAIENSLANRTSNKYEVFAWLRFKQTVESSIASEYAYECSICSNLKVCNNTVDLTELFLSKRTKS